MVPTGTIPASLSFSLGYAGPRRLGPAGSAGREWEPQLRSALLVAARGIRARLSPERPLCIFGALAQGADLALAETLLAQGALLRAWLPEPLDRFANESDFPDPRDRERLAALVGDPGTVEVLVVSSAAERRERFAECAARTVRATEALLCVRHWNAEGARGGTEESVTQARALGRLIVEVRLDPDPAAQAEVSFPSQWTPRSDAAELPFPRPEGRALVAQWKAAASAEAARSKGFIVRSAAWVVALQTSVTIFAVLTLQKKPWEVPSLLAKTAVILTATGITIWSARRNVALRWAERRFVAELQRSWAAVRGLRGPATWLEEDLPPEFASHGRDLALLHGLDCGAHRPLDPAEFGARYARERLGGQRGYAQQTAERANSRRGLLRGIFHGCLAATLVALLTKLGLRAAGSAQGWPALDGICSLVSFVGPTCGAAAVSFIALLDLSASSQTNSRLADYLAAQERLLAAAADWSAVRHVVVATERRLLSEVKSWYARHAFRK